MERRKSVKVVSVVVMMTLWLQLTSVPVLAQRMDRETLMNQLRPVAASDVQRVSSSKLSKTAGSPQLEALAKSGTVAPQAQSTYIVVLKDAPAATYRGGIAGLKPTSPRATNQKKLNLKSADSQAYLQYLDQERETTLSKIEVQLKRRPNVRFEYRLALNGFAAEMTLAEALQVAALPEVARVVPDWIEYKQTDSGPRWMGAAGIWDGTTPGPTKGDSVLVGIIDTGINTNHPSFADIGGDGYDHVWTGSYLGWCNSSDPNYNPTVFACNDKLVGLWSADSYTAAAGAPCADTNGDGVPDVEGGPEDCDGHGSHTAGTVAGNVLTAAVVNAPTASYDFAKIHTQEGILTDTISGVAPHANIIAYNIEGTPGSGSAPGTYTIAATEAAIVHGVDVINYSFGSGGADPWLSAENWYNVREAGILAVTSAGNNGAAANTVGSPGNAPWIMTVGASSHNRKISNALINLTGGGTTPPADIQGEGFTGELVTSSPIVYAGAIAPGNEGCDAVFATGLVTDTIVVCDYNSTVQSYAGRVAKSQNVANSGGVGFILINRQDWAAAMMVDSYAVPGLGISYADGEALKTWLASGTGHQGEIRGFDIEVSRGDIMAGFSSRGPNGPLPDVIKPDVTAPGRRVVAAVASVGGATPPEFDVYQGTSMSSPHAAGAAALVVVLHPDWTPAEIQSALMTTALYNTTGHDNILKQDALTPADPFDMGAGRVDLTTAARAGLLLDEDPQNLWDANPATGGDPTTLNIASLADSRCVGSCTWTRTVKNPTGTTMNWTTAVDAPFPVTVTPDTFTLDVGATQTLTITADVSALPFDEWTFGSVQFTESGPLAPEAHFPIAVQSSAGSMPDAMTINTRRNAGSQVLPDLEAIAITQLTTRSYGLTRGTVTDANLSEDATNDNPYDNVNDGTVLSIPVTVPAGAKRLVTEVLASEAPDLDLFVGTGTTPSEATEVCASTGGSWTERCDISNPTAGAWWIVLQNWEGSTTQPDAVRLAHAVVTGSSAGNLTVTGPASIPAGTPFDLNVTWNIPTMTDGDRWYGAFDLGTDAAHAGNIGAVNVDLVRFANDVTKTVNNPTPAPGTTLTYTITVQPNVTPADLAYTITDTIPAGLTCVPGSATASAGAVGVTGNTLTWTGTMPTMVGAFGTYLVSDSTTDPYCDTGFGGYVDLQAYGIFSTPALTGDSVTWKGFTAQNPIQFYGIERTGLSFTDDGFAFFNSSPGTTPWNHTNLPNTAEPNDLMALFWNDMQVVYNAAANTGISMATNGPDCSVLEYDDVQPYNGDGSVHYDFEVVVYSTIDDRPGYYEIIYAYDNLVGMPNSATIGVENQGGTAATQYLYGNPAGVISDDLMICFDYQGPAFDPVTITYQVTVDANATGTLTNNAAHNTNNPGSQTAYTKVSVVISGSERNYLLWTK